MLEGVGGWVDKASTARPAKTLRRAALRDLEGITFSSSLSENRSQDLGGLDVHPNPPVYM